MTGARERQKSTVESAYFEVIRIKKKDFELSENIKRVKKKMWMTDQKCYASVQGGGGGPNPFLSCCLIADLPVT